MKHPTSLFPIALALGAVIAPGQGAQAAPIPITTCQTISHPGSYVLEKRSEHHWRLPGDQRRLCHDRPRRFRDHGLTARGIAIIAAGANPPPGSPLPTSTRFSGLAVRNGSISNFAGGVVFDTADGSVVEGLRIEALEGIRARGIVRNNTVLNVGVPAGAGIVASGIVTDNYVRGFFRGSGISADGTIRGNIVLDSGAGLFVSAGSTVIGNTAMGNSNGGIGAVCPSNLIDNTAVGNGSFNLSIGSDCLNVNNLGAP